MNEDFKRRLARLDAKKGAQESHSPEEASRLSAPASESVKTRKRPRTIWSRIAVITVVGIAALGWGLHKTSEKLMVLLPAGGFADATILENAVLSRMTPEEIERMNSDPNLAGKSQMERLLLSH